MQTWTNLWPTLKKLLAYSQPYSRPLMLTVMMLWLAAAAEVAGPVLIRYFIDHVLSEKKFPFSLVVGLIVVFLLLQVLSVTLRYYQALRFNRVALSVVQQLRTEVMYVTLCQRLSFFDRQPVGQLISRVTNDTEAVKDLYVTVFASVLRNIALISAMIIAMFLLSYRLAYISLFLFPATIMVMWLYQHYTTPIIRKLRSYIADINDLFNEVISGMSVIQQFRQQQRFAIKLQRASHSHFQTRMATLRLEGYLLRPMISLIFALILCGILVFFSSSPNGVVSVGVLYAFINYLRRLHEPLIELTSQQSIIQQAVVAGERIFELMRGPMQGYGSDNRYLKNGSIVLRELAFSYEQYGAPVLQYISLTAPAKSFIAFVGHTGSGKSTLANLIMGYYPVSEGTLFLDGRSIETLSQQVLRQGVAMVQQDPVIIADTIYENVSLGRGIEEHQVWSALEKVQLATLVRGLSRGLYAELGEQGNTLSAGQKQLLALARVLVSTPAILILDEATAHVDSGTEQAIAQVLQEIRQNTTLLLIAHRLSTIVDADEILVLHSGQVVERGTHSSLLETQGRYYQMYRLHQAGKALDATNNS
ncbi:ABC-type multidrug transport system, ATPase and permease component [secondary endosymbiont of Heteropsylla cubana]|uniref:ABC-type multidrug transport system, ATPase and permease component n=1 Tax=secondary endosymbiont of Heteropsylla cubana TaxID=134287 RepID=J3Z5S9_9ENTR|nr:SmdB family multidrug efflux ABC transporter permease/ATP-binding protein [secondary endosymbiont of Heteropsylla cubana]AFP85714.1 ABC-type multidrug transport system, ATPase and permease component [secondary endosymbiont of Heteropsylla cubana]